jgi:aspartate aminotransferase
VDSAELTIPAARLRLSDAHRRIAAESRRPASLGSVPPGAISLAMGEPFAGTDSAVTDAAIAALKRGNTRYEAMTGSAALRQAIADKLSAESGRAIESAQIVPTHGASAGLAATVTALVNPGDRVVVPEPTYSLYADHIAMIGATVDWVANRPDGSPDVEALTAKLPGAAMVILCNPGNPTGRIMSRNDLHTVAIRSAQAGCYLVSDEAYHDIVFDGLEFASALNLPDQDQVVCCRTFSKSYAMTGWRLGYVVASATVAASINLLHRTFNGALNSFVQEAALTALRLDTGAQLSREYQVRRDVVVDELRALDAVDLATPQGAFYAFPRVDMPITSDELVSRMADAGVLVRSGREYGPSGEGYFRISFATDMASLQEGLRRIRAVLTDLTH